MKIKKLIWFFFFSRLIFLKYSSMISLSYAADTDIFPL